MKGSWVNWYQKMIPVMKEASGEVSLEVNAAQGLRKWLVSDCAAVDGWKEMGAGPTPESRPAVGCRLDEVKDYVLEWPGEAGKHPHLWMTKAEVEAAQQRPPDPAVIRDLLVSGASGPNVYPQINTGYFCALGAWLLSPTPEIVAKTQLLGRLHMAVRAAPASLMTSAGQVCSFYDALIDSPVVPDTERPQLRSQMAYLAYGMADPATWSAERGYCSGNSNMTVNFVLGQGLMACTIPEHPMAKVWCRNADRIMEQMLRNMVGPAGEWPEALGHHGMMSISALLSFAVASTNAGLHDWANDPRMKRLMLYQAKLLTPRDPRPRGFLSEDEALIRNRRYIPAMGRDSWSADQNWALSGIMARATRKSDPAYSAVLQWAWIESGSRCWNSGGKLGGFEYVYCDRSLPAQRPGWTSEVFPEVGAVLRHGLGQPDEHQVMLYSGDHAHAFYPAHTGAFPAIFAYGTPVAGSWAGDYQWQDELLTCHVTLAHGVGTPEERTAIAGYGTRSGGMWNWGKGTPARFGERAGQSNVSAFSTLPRQDYTAVDVALDAPMRMQLQWFTDLPAWPPVPQVGKPPVDWRRQVLFLKDDDPSKTAYLLIRDSVKGGQPTMWQMWTLSEKIGTPDEVKDLTAFLADKPGYTIRPTRELKGDRFTAVGQLGVDVEYYLASPTDTPRYTLRWGTDLFNWANKMKVPEYQDLLHLQLPGDGAYFLAFYPRKRDWPAPTFATLGNGTIIKVSGDFGTDYGFLSALPGEAIGEGAAFQGVAGSVQDRATGLVLSLGAAGKVSYKGYTVQAQDAVSLRALPDSLAVETPAGHPAGTVTVVAPGKWKLAAGTKGVTLKQGPEGLVLALPAGVVKVALTKA